MLSQGPVRSQAAGEGAPPLAWNFVPGQGAADNTAQNSLRGRCPQEIVYPLLAV